MIKITIWEKEENKKKVITRIVVKGHTEKETNTIEPVCAVVSAITLGTVNTLIKLRLINNNLVVEKKDGYLDFNNYDNNAKKQLIFLQMIVQIQTIQKFFGEKVQMQYKKKATNPANKK